MCFPVFRMYALQKAFEIAPERAWSLPVNPLHIVRPSDVARGHVPLPGPDIRRFETEPGASLALSQGRFSGFALSHLAPRRFPQGRHDRGQQNKDQQPESFGRTPDRERVVRRHEPVQNGTRSQHHGDNGRPDPAVPGGHDDRQKHRVVRVLRPDQGIEQFAKQESGYCCQYRHSVAGYIAPYVTHDRPSEQIDRRTPSLSAALV